MSNFKPVVIRGVSYKSGKAAADALGVSSSTVYSARHRGALDMVGTKMHGRPKVGVTIRGDFYKSMSDAARALGLTKMAISAAKKQGRLDTVGLYGATAT